jgi:argininosuccinate lyase
VPTSSAGFACPPTWPRVEHHAAEAESRPFELTRARSALVEGALFTVHALKAKLPGGYHRDFQFLKAPLMRGIELTDEMLAMLSLAVPRLEVDRARGPCGTHRDILATDEALRPRA